MTENLSLSLWPDTQGALVRGLAHALSNRVGTVVAAAGMLAPGAPAPAPIVEMLRDEGDRLEELLGLLRLLGGESGATGEPEPIHLPDIVGPVLALHAQHPDARDVPVSVDSDPSAPPVRARHAGLVRALLVLLAAVTRGVRGTSGGGPRVAWTASAEGVALSVGGAAGEEATATAASALVGAAVQATEAGYRVELPGL